jgi:hypothetical protein
MSTWDGRVTFSYKKIEVLFSNILRIHVDTLYHLCYNERNKEELCYKIYLEN